MYGRNLNVIVGMHLDVYRKISTFLTCIDNGQIDFTVRCSRRNRFNHLNIEIGIYSVGWKHPSYVVGENTL